MLRTLPTAKITVAALTLAMLLAVAPVAAETKVVSVSPAKAPPHPEWESLPPLVTGYGIWTEVTDGASQGPIIVIHGTKGNSKPIRLIHAKAHSWQKGHQEYFVLAGTKIGGNLGMPYAVTFKATVADTIGFRLLGVDYFAKAGTNVEYLASAVDNLDSREPALNFSDGALRKAHIHIPFMARGFLSTENEYHGQDLYQSDDLTLKAQAYDRPGGAKQVDQVPVSEQLHIVDARHAPKAIEFRITEVGEVSSTNVQNAVRSRESTTGMSNTFSVKSTTKSAAEGGGISASTEFEVSNSLTTHSSATSGEVDENGRSVGSRNTKSQSHTIIVDPGAVAFITVRKLVGYRLESAPPLLRIGSNPTGNIVASYKYFRTDSSNGELRLVNVSFNSVGNKKRYSLGSYLKDDKHADLLKMARDAFGEKWSTHMDLTPEARAHSRDK